MESSNTSALLLRMHKLPLQKQHETHPPQPYLDVLSLQSRRLVAQTQAQIRLHEEKARTQARCGETADKCSRSAAHNGEVDAQQQLEELLASVRLLIEPIQIPDLSHTGVFHDSASQLQPTSSAKMTTNATLTLTSVDHEADDTKLFYPTGAKKVTMREYVHETLERHLAKETLASYTLPTSSALLDSSSHRLGISASEPVLATHSSLLSPSSSTTKPAKKASASPLKHLKKTRGKPAAAPHSPTGKSTCGSLLLNPELTRQAKDVIAAIRANSSKINELMGS